MLRVVRFTAACVFALAIATAIAQHAASAQTPPASAGPVDPALIQDLVAANRVLAQEGLFDAYGHVSVRHPGNPTRYLMSRSLAPALVTAGDILEYDLDSNPPGRRTAYSSAAIGLPLCRTLTVEAPKRRQTEVRSRTNAHTLGRMAVFFHVARSLADRL